MAEMASKDPLVQRLDVIISLLLDRIDTDSKVSVSEKILRLLEMGLSQAEVAKIVGKKSNYVGAVVANKAKKKGGKKNAKK